MKMYTSVNWGSTISLATAVVALGIPWNLAFADATVPDTAPATVSKPQAAPAGTVDARPAALPFGVSEVVKMYQGGIGQDIIVSYINNSVLPFHLTADGELYLQRLGMPKEVMAALIQRDGELQRESAAAYQSLQQQQAATIAAANNQGAGNPAPAIAAPGTPPPVITYAYPDAQAPVVYPDYGTYPSYYGYPYFYGPDVFIGGGFGFGHGFGRGFGRGGRGGFGGGHGGGHGGAHR